jgi:DNA processing protein
MPPEEVLYRIAFEEVRLPERIKTVLFARCRSPRHAFTARPAELLGLGLDAGHLRTLREFRMEESARRWKRQCERGARATWPGRPDYPALLAEIPDPPRLLMMRGEFQPDEECVAVVGSRHASPYGKDAARWLGAGLARLGATVVSGAARGVDTAAHRAALKAGGRTAAVLGCGIDQAYPRENARLLERVASSGVVMTEFPPGTPPRPKNFPRRNRIISGLSRAVVVVEGQGRSGSLITARRANDQGRTVYAVPHDLGKEGGGGDGPNVLMRKGEAHLITRPRDVLDDLSDALREAFSRQAEERGLEPSQGAEKRTFSSELEEILGVLSFRNPLQADEIAGRTGQSPARLMGNLMELELAGAVAKLPGLRYVRRRDR